MTTPDFDIALESLRTMHADRFLEDVREHMRLKGDASDRIIIRLRGEQHSSIGIIGPNVDENRAFVGFARRFRERGLRVPEIYRVSGDERCYLEEDLGDETLSLWKSARDQHGAGGEEWYAMYARVLDELQCFQIDAADAVDYGLCYQYPSFADQAMAFDIRYFRDMFLVPIVKLHWDEGKLMQDCSGLIRILLEADRRFFLYRDFQSRNIMIRGGEPWFIDFQSGRRGALHYDVAALLYDSRGGLTDDLRERLLSHYLDRLAVRMSVDRGRFRFLFEGFAVLRLMQALGAFGNIGLNKGRPQYLELIPSRLRSLSALAAAAEVLNDLPYLRSLLIALADDPDACSIPPVHD